MALHLEHFDSDVQTIMRTSAGSGSLEEAMDMASNTFARRPALAAWFFEDAAGIVSFGSGEMVAVYTAGSGWKTLAEDPRPWWSKLSEEAQTALLESSGRSVPAEHVREVTTSGSSVARAAFVQSEGTENWMLTGSLRDFLESMHYRTA